MSKLTQKQIVMQWKTVGPLLESIRFNELSLLPFSASPAAFNGLFEMALSQNKPKETSGLVEFQRILARASVCRS